MYNIEGTIWLLKYFGDLTGKRVVEFGNQRIWKHAKPLLKTSCDVVREWMPCDEYVSIDLNGQDGALPLDLTRPVPEHLAGRFDIVTNVGSTEHFGRPGQWQAFVNAAVLCKVGGLILHQLPPAGQWLDHCDVWYKQGLGPVLAEHLGCELLEESYVNLASLNPDADYLSIALKKQQETRFTDEPQAFREVLC